MPSFKVAEDCHVPPLSLESNTLDKPEVESEPVAVTTTGETYQLFRPFDPLTSKPTSGETVSALAVKLPISELSPHDDNAQKVKLLSPSFNGMAQLEPEQPKVCPFNEPSIAKMDWPAMGSMPLKESDEEVVHQPLFNAQFCSAALTVAGG